MNSNLPELSEEQEQDVRALLASMSEFWNLPSNLTFQKPKVSYEEALPWLRLSAICAARLVPGASRRRLRVSGSGAAKEALWTLFDQFEEEKDVYEFVEYLTSALLEGLIENEEIRKMVEIVVRQHVEEVGVKEKELCMQVRHRLEELNRIVLPSCASSNVTLGARRIEDLKSALRQLDQAQDALTRLEGPKVQLVEVGVDIDDEVEKEEDPKVEEEEEEEEEEGEKGKDDTMDEDEDESWRESSEIPNVKTPPIVDGDNQEDDLEKKNIQEGSLKINKVEQDVSLLGAKIHHLHELADGWREKHNISEETSAITLERDLDRLQRESLGYTEKLMKDLLTLDEVSGAALRPIRKKNVKVIQGLLDDVDRIRKQLSTLHKEVKEVADEERKKVEEEKKEKEKENEEEEDEEESSDLESSSSSETHLDWEKLRLEPRFHSSEQMSSYELVAHIPTLEQDDIRLNLQDTERGAQLIVEGVVYPNQDQLDQLERSAIQTKSMDPRFSNVSNEKLILRLGSGRFGRFESRFALPKDALLNDINATLRGGYLRVSIPRKAKRRPRRNPYRSPLYW